MKILVASDSFKGTMTSREVGRIIREELAPFHEVDYLPVSDGGEGFLDAWSEVFPGRRITITGQDPLGREIICEYLISGDRTAIIESAVTIGLGLLTETEQNPMDAGSFGLGILVRDALQRGAKNIYIGLGGSAVNEGGVGMLQALGVKILDRNGHEINASGGKVLSLVAGMDISGIDPVITGASIYAVCDVDSPLLGPRGATRVFGPQKGADPVMIEMLETGMANLSKVAIKVTGNDYSDTPGAGAAGGLGFSLKSFFDARIINGIDALVQMTGLEDRISQYDLIITGEGKLDSQTESGKVPYGMLRLGEKHHIPVVCVCGVNESVENMGFEKILSIVPGIASLEESKSHPDFFLKKMIREELVSLIGLFKSI